jgi:hypothetical protein
MFPYCQQHQITYVIVMRVEVAVMYAPAARYLSNTEMLAYD